MLISLSGLPWPPQPRLNVAVVHVVDEDALALDQIQLARLLVQREDEDAVWQRLRILVVLPQRRERLAWLRLRSAMTEIPQELPVARELQDALATSAGREPDVTVPIHDNGVLVLGPERMMPGPAPRTQQVARRVELEDRRRGHAALGARRRRGSAVLVGPDVARAAEDPDMVVVVRDHRRDPLQQVLVPQRHLRPGRVDLVDGDRRSGHGALRGRSPCLVRRKATTRSRRLVGLKVGIPGRQGERAARGCHPSERDDPDSGPHGAKSKPVASLMSGLVAKKSCAPGASLSSWAGRTTRSTKATNADFFRAGNNSLRVLRDLCGSKTRACDGLNLPEFGSEPPEVPQLARGAVATPGDGFDSATVCVVGATSRAG